MTNSAPLPWRMEHTMIESTMSEDMKDQVVATCERLFAEDAMPETSPVAATEDWSNRLCQRLKVLLI
jgi:hypothetical protein